jgi:type IV pilus assembly protein PilE
MNCSCVRPVQSGLTLLELLIALVIVGILTSLALPGYSAVLQRAHRNEARLALLGIQHAQERYYQRHFRYTDQMAAGGLAIGERSAGGSYQLEVALQDEGQSYLASATPVTGGRQAGDRECAALTVDETGRRGGRTSAGNDASTACWR